MSDKIHYLVMRLEKTVEIATYGITHKEIPLILADGMVGMMPIFDSEDAAKKYADGDYEIVPVKVGKE